MFPRPAKENETYIAMSAAKVNQSDTDRITHKTIGHLTALTSNQSDVLALLSDYDRVPMPSDTPVQVQEIFLTISPASSVVMSTLLGSLQKPCGAAR